MKKTRLLLRTFMFAALLGGIAVSATSCKDSGSETELRYGTVSGKIVDEVGAAVSGATVTVSGMAETTTSGSDGSYTFNNVSQERHSVEASKQGYQSVSKTVRANSFTNGKVENLDISLVRANSKISGTVLDARNGNTPLSGVVVKAGTKSFTTEADGKFEIVELALADYGVSFTYSDYPVVTVNVVNGDFVNEVFNMGNIYIGGGDILPTLDRYELASAVKLLYDDYRSGSAGGSGTTGGPYWDWSTSFMAAIVDRVGNWETQNEGFTLRPKDSSLEGKETNLNQFDTFFYGLKEITSTNSKMTVRVRAHQGPVTFGVRIVDLSAPSPEAVEIAHYDHPGGSYTNYNFDLSDYEGKEVVVAVGQYINLANNSADAKDYWHQCVVARMTFSSAYIPTADTWWPGTEVIAGWKLTRNMVANTGVQSRVFFNGISPDGTSQDRFGMNKWYGTDHIGVYWGLVGVKKDIEPIKNEGFVLKTSGGDAATVNTLVPESFLYAKFAIAEGANNLIVRARTMSTTNTFFKLAAFDDNGELLDFIQPSSGTIGSAGPDDTWKFALNDGSYGQFEFDLSAYNGKNVTVAFGVIKGENNTEENKLAIQSIALQ